MKWRIIPFNCINKFFLYFIFCSAVLALQGFNNFLSNWLLLKYCLIIHLCYVTLKILLYNHNQWFRLSASIVKQIFSNYIKRKCILNTKQENTKNIYHLPIEVVLNKFKFLKSTFYVSVWFYKRAIWRNNPLNLLFFNRKKNISFCQKLNNFQSTDFKWDY